MVKKPKFGKISIVVFLTVLIWVWADLAQDETLPLSNFVKISVARYSDPTRWISFVGPEETLLASVTLDNVDLKGPASRVAEVERTKNKGELELDLFLVPEQEDMVEPGMYTRDVLNFLRQSDEIRRLGLTVESCEPRALTIQVRQLEEKSLRVECVDLNGAPVRGATVIPPQVEHHVPDEGTYVAKVQLSADEQNQARTAPIQKMPYVDFAPGQRRAISTPVSVSLPPEEIMLAERAVRATVGFCFSPILQGRYRVELNPQSETELASVFVKATPAALEAYQDQRFHILLYILDDDRQATDWIARAVEFNFPQEFVQKGEIEVDEAPTALFKLVPVGADAEGTPER